LFSDHGVIFGGMAGFTSSKLTLNTSSMDQSQPCGQWSSHMNATLSGPTAGLYVTYFNGGFSTDFLVKVDIFTLKEISTESLAFTNAGTGAGPFSSPFAGSGSTNLLNGTVADNLNYRFDLSPRFWVEPTAGAQFTSTTYEAGAADLGLADGLLVMVQGGVRLGTDFLIGNSVQTTAIITGLAYDDVLVNGGFIGTLGFAGNNLLAQVDQGQVRGRGVVALNFDLGQGVTAFVQGEARGGKGLFGAGGNAGVRVHW
jgi:hypothetical protein